jgi:hypothetical protein
MSDQVWTGPTGIGWFNRERIPELVRSSLTRAQLRDLIGLAAANPEFDFAKLVALIVLQEHRYQLQGFLDQYGLIEPQKISALEDANYARMERSELEERVLSFMN